MVKVGIAIGLVFLVAALSVFGSPFFAVLLLVPAGILAFAFLGGAVVAEETGPEDSRKEPGPPKTSEAGQQN